MRKRLREFLLYRAYQFIYFHSFLSEIVLNSKLFTFKHTHELVSYPYPKIFQIYGVQRSGNHLIIKWVCEGLGNSIHLNNLSLSYNLFDKYLVPDKIKIYRKLEGDVFTKDYIRRSKFLSIKSLRKILSSPELITSTLIYSFENILFPIKFSPELNITKKIIVLRDPANFIASFLKLYGVNSKKTKRVIKVYKSYLKLYVDQKENSQILFINFNQFVQNFTYRRKISISIKDHKFERANKCLEEVSDFGGGSSFTKLKPTPDVFNRWKFYHHSDYYKELCSDKELINLATNFFQHPLPGYKEMGISPT